MSEPQPAPAQRFSRRRRSRRRSLMRRAFSALAAWWVEILVVLLLAAGIFLLTERMNIRQAVAQGLRQALAGLISLGRGFLSSLGSWVGRTTLSDLAGYVLIIAATGFVVWRARWRLMTSASLTTRLCPRCGGEVHRIHRRSLDRLISLVVPVRRYQCRDHACGWNGLRVGGKHYG